MLKRLALSGGFGSHLRGRMVLGLQSSMSTCMITFDCWMVRGFVSRRRSSNTNYRGDCAHRITKRNAIALVRTAEPSKRWRYPLVEVALLLPVARLLPLTRPREPIPNLASHEKLCCKSAPCIPYHQPSYTLLCATGPSDAEPDRREGFVYVNLNEAHCNTIYVRRPSSV